MTKRSQIGRANAHLSENRWSKRHVFVSTLLLSLLTLLASACSFGKDKSIAEAGVAQFHRQFNASQFREIYIESDERMKKAATEIEFLTLLQAVRRKLGSVQQSTQAGWRVNVTTNGTTATLNYRTDFNEGKGTESFVFYISADKATLAGYHIDSPLLITK